VAPWLLPGALVVGFGFSAGGFFARTVAVGVVALCALLAIRLLAGGRPLEGFGAWPAAVCAALTLLAGWTFLSGEWSESPGRALYEFDRVLLYLLAFVLMASLARTTEHVRWVVRGLLAGIVVVCGAGLVTRMLPELAPSAATVEAERLSYPLMYWNAVGILCATGLVLAFALTSDLREHAAVRVASAGALPVLAATLLFTFSRASVLLAVVGLLVLAAASRSRGLVSALLVLPAAIVAVSAAYNADELSSERPTSALAVDQGQDVALVVLLCTVGAIVARWTLLRLDDRLGAAARLRAPRARRVPRAAWAVGAVVVAAAALAAGAGTIERQYDRFVEGDTVELEGADAGDNRARFANAGNNGRLLQWDAALRGFEDDRLKGTGAGTFALTWSLHRESFFQVQDAHSLYLEALSELGVAGLAFVVLALVALLGGLLVRVRGPDRTLYAALFTATLVWAVHAGVDWDWEMPAVTGWVFAAGGAALAAGPARGAGWRLPVALRIAVAVGCVVLALTPLRVAQSDYAAQASKRAFARGDCERASARAQDAVDALSVTPEPLEILGYCHLRAGRAAPAVQAMRAAVAKDPRNWRVHYGLAVAHAVAGRDPRPEVRVARRLNPENPLAYELELKLAGARTPARWRATALRARIPSD